MALEQSASAACGRGIVGLRDRSGWGVVSSNASDSHESTGSETDDEWSRGDSETVQVCKPPGVNSPTLLRPPGALCLPRSVCQEES